MTDQVEPDEADLLVLQCVGGKRSLMAAHKLQAAGFGHVTHLAGGLQAWKAAGLPTVRIDPQIAAEREATLTSAFRPALTAEGRRSSVFRLEADLKLNETMLASLPGMYWFARTQGTRPGADLEGLHRRQAGQTRRITAQAMRAPELPVGWVL